MGRLIIFGSLMLAFGGTVTLVGLKLDSRDRAERARISPTHVGSTITLRPTQVAPTRTVTVTLPTSIGPDRTYIMPDASFTVTEDDLRIKLSSGHTVGELIWANVRK